MLVLLNGPPASGKSTLAERLVELRPLALALDVDLVRGRLGGWIERPTEAGLAARALAVAMADTHLRAGHDVVVPQLLARPDFVHQLEAVCEAAGATFVELALDLPRDATIAAFAERSRTAERSTHRDAAELVARSSHDDPVGALHDALERFLRTRADCRRIAVERGDIDATLAEVRRAIGACADPW